MYGVKLGKDKNETNGPHPSPESCNTTDKSKSGDLHSVHIQSLKHFTEAEQIPQAKKAKRQHQADVSLESPGIEYENIDAIVDARLREKAERHRLDKHKRKRESSSSDIFTEPSYIPCESRFSHTEEDHLRRKRRKKSNDPQR